MPKPKPTYLLVRKSPAQKAAGKTHLVEVVRNTFYAETYIWTACGAIIQNEHLRMFRGELSQINCKRCLNFVNTHRLTLCHYK